VTPNFYIFFGIIGLIFGSFFNVVIHRLPKFLDKNLTNKNTKLSLVKALSYPNSHCPSCKKSIKWFDNIPVLSWLFLQGKCRQCRKKISSLYALVELTTMCAFMFVYWQYGLSFEALGWIVFFSLIILLFFIDLTSFYLPDIFTYPLIGAGLLMSFVGLSGIHFTNALIGCALGFLIFFGINLLYKKWRGTDGFGASDKILLAGLGSWLGFKSLYPVIMFSSLFGLLFMFVMLAFGRKYKMETMLPFGPFLILSSLLVYIHLYVYPITFMRFFYEL
jgi:leader peptidase (prepilin peptidase)/N-methyltransferase